MTPAVIWPTLLGVSFLVVGVITYWRDARTVATRDVRALAPFVVLGPTFVAAAIAAFAGEHFTAATALATLVPKWLPARVFIAYFVGVAHLAAALSFVARRYMRWSTIGLATMFGLFVLLMDLPGAIARPTNPLNWALAARQATFSMGALALFATVTRTRSPQSSQTLATIAGIWTACVLVFYGILHLMHPERAPGVPSPVLTAAWVPFPQLVAYATGALLIAFGIMMLFHRSAIVGAALCGLLMTLLTLGLYVPQFFLAENAQQQITAINFIFDTLLFAGTLLVISKAISDVDQPTTAA
ncbi:MAG TPA: hypothetical protein VK636_06250 [Gemmatimonadaceae bacterium]|nr:hypothetical protein [Gemmatimonadaceae bacterium]